MQLYSVNQFCMGDGVSCVKSMSILLIFNVTYIPFTCASIPGSTRVSKVGSTLLTS